MNDPIWKRASEMSKAAMTVWALVAALAGSVGGYVWRHFTAPERVARIEATLDSVASVLAEQRAEKEVETKIRAQLITDCRTEAATLGECVRRGLGPEHPRYGLETRGAE